MNIPNYSTLNSNNCTEKYIKNHYPEFYKYIKNTYKSIQLWTEKLYWYYNNLTEYPKCKVCNNPVKFINLKQGYREFCSRKCLNSCKQIQERKKETCIKKYGVENAMQNSKIKEKLKKTNIERFGEDNIFKTKSFKENLKKKNLEKYGVEYYIQTQECQEKIKNTCLKKYEVLHNSQNKYIKEKIKESWNSDLYIKDPYIMKIEDGYVYRNCSNPNCNLCKEKQYKILRYLHNSRMNHNQEICPIKNPIGQIGKNTSIELFIRDLLDSYNIEYETNVRNIISPKEIDIYIPSKKIAIECNGIYWHSTIYKNDNYHYEKFIEAENKKIQLLTIWEDQLINKPDIIKSIILSKLGIYKEKIGARKCIIKNIQSKTCNQFLNTNHLQGSCPSTVKLGLYYNNELISIMTFSRKRLGIGVLEKDEKNQWELVRFCNKQHYQVIGGASKLLKYFIENYNPTTIISFSSNDISNGNLYKKLGFNMFSKLKGSYWYIDPNNFKRYHRFKFRKSELVKMGFDKEKSERQIMEDSKYLKIFDSGQIKWVMNM